MIDLIPRQLEALARSKGLSQEAMVAEIESALRISYQKFIGSAAEVKVRLVPGRPIQVSVRKQIVAVVQQGHSQVSHGEALALANTRPEAFKADLANGDFIEVPIRLETFGRVAAQAFKQVLANRLRELEYTTAQAGLRPGTVVQGKIVDFESAGRGSAETAIVTVNKIECELPYHEQVSGEGLTCGQELWVYVVSGRALSRTHPGLAHGLLMAMVPEFSGGKAAVMTLERIVREPGLRTKAVVKALNPGVVVHGLEAVATELGEFVELVALTGDIAFDAIEALKPAVVDRVATNSDGSGLTAYVREREMPKAIGLKGSNVRCASKLLGRKIELRAV